MGDRVYFLERKAKLIIDNPKANILEKMEIRNWLKAMNPKIKMSVAHKAANPNPKPNQDQVNLL